MTAENPPGSPTAAESADKAWRLDGMSPAAIEAARAAARRAGVPLAAWLSGLIHHVADRENAARETVGQDGGE